MSTQNNHVNDARQSKSLLAKWRLGEASRRTVVESLEGRLFLSAADLDPTFGTGGRVLLTTSFIGSGFTAVAAAPGGKYVAVGENYPGNDILVARFNANGTRDTTFGGGKGVVTTNFGAIDTATAVSVLSSGKILVSGYGAATDGRHFLICIARYNTNGTLDTTFGGGDGKVTTDFGQDFAFTGGMKVLSSGKFLVAGTSVSDATRGDFALAKYNADGTLDKSFGGGDGMVTADFGGANGFPGTQIGNGIAVNSAGQIYVTGMTFVREVGNQDIGVARFTSAGVFDKSFGGGKGWVKTDLTFASNPGATDEAKGIAITPAGKVLVAGYSRNDGRPSRFALVQYTASGTLDTSFGGGTGKVLTNLNPDPLSNNKPSTHLNLDYNGSSLAVTSAGKIVVAGYANGVSFGQWGNVTAETHGIGVARYNVNGSLDSTFGVDGKKPLLAMTGPVGVIVDSGGKIVIAGGVSNKAALVRLGTPAVATASISGTFFNDKNGDGIRQSVTEPLLADWQAYVDSNNNGVYDYGESTAFTNASGTYTIKGLQAGTYRIREVRKDGWARTKPAGAWPLGYYDVKLGIGMAVGGKVFANQKFG
jgi:uncharacterized delta-60 repeat protein